MEGPVQSVRNKLQFESVFIFSKDPQDLQASEWSNELTE